MLIFTDHTLGVYPTNSAGIPFSADTFQSVGDPISDLTEDMAAEQKLEPLMITFLL